MERNKAYYRYQRERNIEKKYSKRKKLWGTEMTESYYSSNPKGELSKGKIHCSCPMCREKSYERKSHRDRKMMYIDSFEE